MDVVVPKFWPVLMNVLGSKFWPVLMDVVGPKFQLVLMDEVGPKFRPVFMDLVGPNFKNASLQLWPEYQTAYFTICIPVLIDMVGHKFRPVLMDMVGPKFRPVFMDLVGPQFLKYYFLVLTWIPDYMFDHLNTSLFQVSDYSNPRILILSLHACLEYLITWLLVLACPQC